MRATEKSEQQQVVSKVFIEIVQFVFGIKSRDMP